MKELLEYVATSISLQPDEVEVTVEEEKVGRLVYTLEVASEDKGRIIGRHGRVAKSIRLLLRVAAVKKGVHATLDIV